MYHQRFYISFDLLQFCLFFFFFLDESGVKVEPWRDQSAGDLHTLSRGLPKGQQSQTVQQQWHTKFT